MYRLSEVKDRLLQKIVTKEMIAVLMDAFDLHVSKGKIKFNNESIESFISFMGIEAYHDDVFDTINKMGIALLDLENEYTFTVLGEYIIYYATKYWTDASDYDYTYDVVTDDEYPLLVETMEEWVDETSSFIESDLWDNENPRRITEEEKKSEAQKMLLRFTDYTKFINEAFNDDDSFVTICSVFWDTDFTMINEMDREYFQAWNNEHLELGIGDIVGEFTKIHLDEPYDFFLDEIIIRRLEEVSA